MESTHYNLCFAWQGDYDSLKTFFSNELKLDDVWAQSGGDKMVFSTTDVSISWRKSKNLLYIVGDEMGKYMELFCSKIYKGICPKSQLPTRAVKRNRPLCSRLFVKAMKTSVLKLTNCYLVKSLTVLQSKLCHSRSRILPKLSHSLANNWTVSSNLISQFV